MAPAGVPISRVTVALTSPTVKPATRKTAIDPSRHLSRLRASPLGAAGASGLFAGPCGLAVASAINLALKPSAEGANPPANENECD